MIQGGMQKRKDKIDCQFGNRIQSGTRCLYQEYLGNRVRF
jgi:hypothetical protein